MKLNKEILVKGLSIVAGALVCAAGLSACSVKATSPAVNVTPPSSLGTAAKAMSAEGTWATDCRYEQGNYMREHMTLKDNNITVRVELYDSSSCFGAPFVNVSVDGTMLRYGTSFYVAGGHDVEVTTYQDGTSTTTRTVFLIENSMLYTSDRNTGSPGAWPMAIDRTRPYRYIGGL